LVWDEGHISGHHRRIKGHQESVQLLIKCCLPAMMRIILLSSASFVIPDGQR
jgi:hypothetical protein